MRLWKVYPHGRYGVAAYQLGVLKWRLVPKPGTWAWVEDGKLLVRQAGSAAVQDGKLAIR